MNSQVVVQVWLKEAVLDPQGQAVMNALVREGLKGVQGVRQGKVFFIEFDSKSVSSIGSQQALIERLSRELLANPVIEDFEIVWPTQTMNEDASRPNALVTDLLDGDA